jgi:phenylacetate-CoA ligase
MPSAIFAGMEPVAHRAIWDPSIETLPRVELVTLQTRRLTRQLRRLQRRSVFYRAKFEAAGVDSDRLFDLDEFADRVPLTTKAELRRNQEACIDAGRLPYDDLLCVSPDEVRVVIGTSGATGASLLMPFTESDRYLSSLALGATALRGMVAAGMGPGDVLLYCYNMGGAIVGGGAGFLTIGGQPPWAPFALVPGHVGKSRHQLGAMQSLGVTAFYGTPSYILYLAELARAEGMDARRDFALRTIVVGGEPGPVAVPSMRTRIEEAWNARCFDMWGQAETQTRAHECRARAGFHTTEDLHLYEVLDPETHRPAQPGEIGVLVVTCLVHEAAPLVRFNTNDLVELDDSPCACGRTNARIVRIVGRADDMVKVRSVRFHATDVARIVAGLPEATGRHLIVLDRDAQGRETLALAVEVRQGVTPSSALTERVAAEIRNTIGLTPHVTLPPEGTLERSSVKTTTIMDLRDPANRERYRDRTAMFRAF